MGGGVVVRRGDKRELVLLEFVHGRWRDFLIVAGGGEGDNKGFACLSSRRVDCFLAKIEHPPCVYCQYTYGECPPAVRRIFLTNKEAGREAPQRQKCSREYPTNITSVMVNLPSPAEV